MSRWGPELDGFSIGSPLYRNLLHAVTEFRAVANSRSRRPHLALGEPHGTACHSNALWALARASFRLNNRAALVRGCQSGSASFQCIKMLDRFLGGTPGPSLVPGKGTGTTMFTALKVSSDSLAILVKQ